jgi:tRNA (cmo5U34)-methyltransferase
MSWKFDKSVAKVFPSHARSHIPHYDEVITQCIEVCSSYEKNSPIIDVGVATGETITRLHNAGFVNLFGVDNSQDMLDACPQNIATLVHSSRLPQSIHFDVVLMNWTLHFIEDKMSYLEDIYNSLNSGGVLVLSEKVSNDDITTKFYYDFKRRNGLTEQQIIDKAQSLDGVMHINSVDWYHENLRKIGFKRIYLMNAYWGFASFVAFKG